MNVSSTMPRPTSLHTNTDEGELPRIPVVTSLAFLSFGSVLGNSLVLIAISSHSALRRVTYMPIFSLALADFLAGLVAMPSYIMKKFEWSERLDRIVCDVFRFSYFVTGYASVLSLAVVSVERLIAIRSPLTYPTVITSRRVGLALASIWFDTLVISSLPFAPWPSITPFMECHYNPTRWWSIMVIITNVIVPFLVIAACYTYMYLIAKSHIRKISGDRRSGHKKQVQQQKETTERRANITIMIVIGVFVASWFPSSFYYFLQKTCQACFSQSFKSKQSLVNALVKIFTFSSSFANPIIYCWRSRHFRNAFVNILMKKWWRVPNFLSKSSSSTAHFFRRRGSTIDSSVYQDEHFNAFGNCTGAGKYALKPDVLV